MSAATFGSTTRTQGTSAVNRAGKYLTFRLGAEEYGIPILKVREIIGMMPITRMPEAPSHVRGIINLRGRVIPVLELRARFGMETVTDSEETCIIVVDLSDATRSLLMGILVDAVSEVLDIKTDEIQDSPSLGADQGAEFILGIGKVKGGVMILLDIDKVLTGASIAAVLDRDALPSSTLTVANACEANG